MPYSQRYLFIPDTNHNANPTNPNRYSKGNPNPTNPTNPTNVPTLILDIGLLNPRIIDTLPVDTQSVNEHVWSLRHWPVWSLLVSVASAHWWSLVVTHQWSVVMSGVTATADDNDTSIPMRIHQDHV